MRRIALYMLPVILAVVSCEKQDGLRSDSITFSARETAPSRAMMNDADLKTNGNRLYVYDWLTGFTGTASWMDANSYYINDEISYSGSPIWDYESGRIYPWTTNGEHHFFSWLSYDQDLDLEVEDFCNPTFTPATRTLSIPALEMDENTPQFDFMYSSVKTVDASAPRASTSVDLELNHLFTALNLTLNNTSGNIILLKSVTLTGLKNTRSATIAFTQLNPVVDTDNISSTDVPLYTSTASGGDVFVSEDLEKPLTNFLLMWPQTYAELGSAALHVVYVVRVTKMVDGNPVTEDSDELSADVVLANQNIFKRNQTGMDAGTKYTFMLQFKKSTLDIRTSALPWEYETFDWDYSDHSISARSGMFKDGVLAFYRGVGEDAVYPTTDEWSAKTMRFTSRSETMTGRFYIEAPTSGRWQVTAYPLSAAQYFIIEPTSGDIDVNMYNGKAEFTVKVNTALSPESTQTLYFNISIYFNGEWHDANSEFNRKNIKLVLDAN